MEELAAARAEYAALQGELDAAKASNSRILAASMGKGDAERALKEKNSALAADCATLKGRVAEITSVFEEFQAASTEALREYRMKEARSNCVLVAEMCVPDETTRGQYNREEEDFSRHTKLIFVPVPTVSKFATGGA